MADNRYPNMSYCMFEKTALAIDQILDHMLEAQENNQAPKFLEDMSPSEKRAYERMYDMCRQFVQLSENFEQMSVEEDEDYDHE